MTPEVKQRIEQIRQGIVPEGYKKTESGIIPNEWRVGQVSNGNKSPQGRWTS